MLTSFVVISNSITTYKITVYDTTGSVNPTGSSPHLRTLSLREVGTCDDIVTQYNPPSLDNFEVLRRVSEPIINILTSGIAGGTESIDTPMEQNPSIDVDVEGSMS